MRYIKIQEKKQPKHKKRFNLRIAVMDVNSSYGEGKQFSSYQALCIFMSAVMVAIVTFVSVEIDLFLEPLVVRQGIAIFSTSGITIDKRPGCSPLAPTHQQTQIQT